ncbi:MAG: amidase [Thermoleophilaceae bacterium]
MTGDDLAFAGIARQAELIRAGDLSPRELVDLYLDRIERIDPTLNAFRAVFAERARAEAGQAEARREAGEERPLLGVPIAVKDNVAVAGEVTALGSDAYGEPESADAEVVRRLRAAGAILIGKTHMSELALYPYTETATWGVTQNPWQRGRSPGGSSGGSGAAVAAGLVGAASASDGGGSIRIPAACCGLFGLKPQRGRVPLAPDGEHWHGLSVSGTVTRTVSDTALYLDVVSDPSQGARPFVEAAGADPGKLRIALSYKPDSPTTRLHPDVRRAVEEVAQVLRGLGHNVEERDPDIGTIDPMFAALYLRGALDEARTLPHPERLERRTRSMIRAARLISDSTLARARSAAERRGERIQALFSDFDVLLTPTLPVPTPATARFEGRSWLTNVLGAGQLVGYARVWNLTGQPAAALPTPALDDRGLPLSAQLIGRPGDEDMLISLSGQLERETRWPERRPADS